jgi:hypothetical protein
MAILKLLRKGMTVGQMVDELNKARVLTIQGKPWNYYSLQMQIGKMAKLDESSSLAWGLRLLKETGEANDWDLANLRMRTRSIN